MPRKATLSEVRTFLARQGLEHNPIEKITNHRDGSTTVWVVGLSEPLTMKPIAKDDPPLKKERGVLPRGKRR
jgi:hypothetical protein